MCELTRPYQSDVARHAKVSKGRSQAFSAIMRTLRGPKMRKNKESERFRPIK